MPPIRRGTTRRSARPRRLPAATPWLRAADLSMRAASTSGGARASGGRGAPREGIVPGQAALVNLAGGADAYGRGSAVVADRVALRLDARTSLPPGAAFQPLIGPRPTCASSLDARFFPGRHVPLRRGSARPSPTRLRPDAAAAGRDHRGRHAGPPAGALADRDRARGDAGEGARVATDSLRRTEAFEATAALASAGASVLVALDRPAAAKDPDPEAHETCARYACA